MITRRHLLASVGASATVLALAACSGTSTPAASTSGAAAASGPASLTTVTAGKLTVATGQPAYSPWVEDDKPESGKGFESAVTYAVAKQLGYAASDVVWARSSFDSAITPGAKTWDLNIQQFSITADRRKVVDFSSPYYTTTQAVVTTKGSKADGVTTLAGLKGLKIGVATGTTSYTVVNAQLGQPAVFSTVDDAVQALKTKQVDAVVTDLPGAFYIAGAQLDDGVVSGQFASSSDGGDQFAYVLPKGSALTKPVSAAIDAITKSGELKQLTDTWLSSAVKVPRAPVTLSPSAVELERRAFRRGRTSRSIGVAIVSSLVVVVAVWFFVVNTKGWAAAQQTFFDPAEAVKTFPAVLAGLWVNLYVLFFAAIGVALFATLLAVIRTLRGPVFAPLRFLAAAYTDVFRGIPMIVLIYLVGFGIPALGVLPIVDPRILGGVALVIGYSAYVSEVLRAGIESVHPSQRLAARSLGLTYGQTLRLVVLPQGVRRVVPALMNDFVSMQKDVGLISILGVVDAISAANIAKAISFNYTAFVIAGLLFILLSLPFIQVTNHLERRALARQQQGAVV